MANPDLSGKRVLLLGAETELGGAIAAALADAGARAALVGATNDAETAFAVQRLARKVGAEISQAIDATNEAAVRVMVRQVSKALGGLDGVVHCQSDPPNIPDELNRPDSDDDALVAWIDKNVPPPLAVAYLTEYAARELERKNGGPIVAVGSIVPGTPASTRSWNVPINPKAWSAEEAVARVLAALAAPAA